MYSTSSEENINVFLKYIVDVFCCKRNIFGYALERERGNVLIERLGTQDSKETEPCQNRGMRVSRDLSMLPRRCSSRLE